MNVFEQIRNAASLLSPRIAITGATRHRVLEAAAAIRRDGIGEPVLVGSADAIEAAARARSIPIAGIRIVEPTPEAANRYLGATLAARQSRGALESEVRASLRDPDGLASAIVRSGDADVLLSASGSPGVDPWAETRSGSGLIAECFVVGFNGGGGFLAVDPRATAEPSATTLAGIALMTASNARRLLDVEPHIGFVAPTVFAPLSARDRHRSASETLSDRVWQAAETVRIRDESVRVARQLLTEVTAGPDAPNIWVFVQRQAGNAAYDLARRFPGSRAVGPATQGLDIRFNVLTGSGTVSEIVDLAALTSVVV